MAARTGLELVRLARLLAELCVRRPRQRQPGTGPAKGPHPPCRIWAALRAIGQKIRVFLARFLPFLRRSANVERVTAFGGQRGPIHVSGQRDRDVGGVDLGLAAEWLFAFDGRLSVTISGADRLLDTPRETLAHTIWQEVAKAARLPVERMP